MIPMPDQPSVMCPRTDVYEFRPFGEGCWGVGLDAPHRSIKTVTTNDGVMEVCEACSAARFVPYELRPESRG